MLNVKVLRSFVFLFFLSLFPAPLMAHHSPELVVFFIHGVGANGETFCDFPEVLEEQITQTLGRERAVWTHILEYPSKKNSTGTTWDFAKTIAGKIARYYSSNNIPTSVPYAFVAHSQGGLVGKKYIRRCLMKKECGSLPQNLAHYISIGTPHHGSSGGNFLIRGLRGIFGNRGFFLRLQGMQEQTASLAVGSVTLAYDRLDSINFQSEYKRRTRFHNIIGATDFNDYGVVSRLSLGRELESDMVVSTTSAKQDFHYCVMQNEKSPLRCGTTNLVQRSNVHIIDLPHSSLPFESFVADMKCVERGLPHPSLDIVRKTLLTQFYGISQDNSSVPKAPPHSQRLQNFAVDLHIYFPKNSHRGPLPRDITIGFNANDYQDVSSYLIRGGLAHQYKGYNSHDFEMFSPIKDTNSVSYFHIGKIESDEQQTEFVNGRLRTKGTVREHFYEVRYPGYKPFQFRIPVSAGTTSFAKIYLEPLDGTPLSTESVYDPDRETQTAGRMVVRPLSPQNLESFIPPQPISTDSPYNLTFNPETLYRLKTIRPFLSRHRKLGPCHLGSIAALTPPENKNQLMEPTRYSSFSSPNRAPHIPFQGSDNQASQFKKVRKRLVRIHGRFKQGSIDRYIVSRKKTGLTQSGFQVFWIDTKDVEVLSPDFISDLDLRENQRIHRHDVCQ